MTTKTVELSVLISLINNYQMPGVTPDQQVEVVSHIHGSPVGEDQQDMFQSAATYLKDKYPKIAEAAALVVNFVPDLDRYKKLIDLFKMWYQIEPMSVTELQPA